MFSPSITLKRVPDVLILTLYQTLENYHYDMLLIIRLHMEKLYSEKVDCDGSFY